MAEQLELFPMSENDMLRTEISSVKTELSNVRRGLFSRHNEILKLLCELRAEFEAHIAVIDNEEKKD